MIVTNMNDHIQLLSRSNVTYIIEYLDLFYAEDAQKELIISFKSSSGETMYAISPDCTIVSNFIDEDPNLPEDSSLLVLKKESNTLLVFNREGSLISMYSQSMHNQSILFYHYIKDQINKHINNN